MRRPTSAVRTQIGKALPDGAIVSEIDGSTLEILVQAYSFTSTEIARALVNVHKRGYR
jgi:hypothetical protein